MGTSDPVLVVGAGVVGSSIAFHLARRGCKVVLVDGNPPGAVPPASPGSFGWLNASTATERQYFELRNASLGLWRGLKEAHPDLPVRFSGCLLWEEDEEEIRQAVDRLQAWNYEVEAVTGAAVSAMEPGIRQVPGLAFHAPHEGIADPDAIADWFRLQAAALGAEILSGCTVSELSVSAARVTGVQAGRSLVRASGVVIAAGCGSQDLLEQVGFLLPMENEPGLIIKTNPLPPLIGRIVGGRDVHLWQGTDGRLRAGADYGGNIRFDEPENNARAIVAAIGEALNYDGAVEAEAFMVTPRPKPADGYPAIGRIPGVEGLFAAVMHSGMTLAPMVGKALCGEILDGVVDPLILPYRPERLAAGKSAA